MLETPNNNDNHDAWVDFAPDVHQLARVQTTRPFPRLLIALPLLTVALLTAMWLTAAPGAAVSNGTISLSATETVSSKNDLFQLPAWQDEPASTRKPAPIETADLR